MIGAALAHALFALCILPAARAANDWSKPCLDGVCSYDAPASPNHAPGVLSIWGPKEAISDITAAAGWAILSCQEEGTTQDVRMVCNTADTALCDHLFTEGAVDTVVRLPENCGQNPFARVASMEPAADQSLPSGFKLVPGAPSRVWDLTLDTAFHKATPRSSGEVSFSISGGASDVDMHAPHGRRDDIAVPLGPRDFDQALEPLVALGARQEGVLLAELEPALLEPVAALGSGHPSKGTPAKVAPNTAHLTPSAPVAAVAPLIVLQALPPTPERRLFDNHWSQRLPHIHIHEQLTIADKSTECMGRILHVSVHSNTTADADVSIGIVARGSLLPPRLDEFTLVSGVSTRITGYIALSMSGQMHVFDTNMVPLFEKEIPFFDIPGIFRLTPAFRIYGRASLDFAANLDVQVNIDYALDNAVFAFPPSSQYPNVAAPTPGSTPFALAVTPNYTATGSVVVHMIPSLEMNIQFLENITSGNALLQLDSAANITLQMWGDALSPLNTTHNATLSPNATAAPANATTTGTASASPTLARRALVAPAGNVSVPMPLEYEPLPDPLPPPPSAPPPTMPRMGGTYSPPARAANAVNTTKDPFNSDWADRGLVPDAEAGTNGCVYLTGMITANLGISHTLFNVFSNTTRWPVFTGTYPLYSECFGRPPPKKLGELAVAPAAPASPFYHQHSRRAEAEAADEMSLAPAIEPLYVPPPPPHWHRRQRRQAQGRRPGTSPVRRGLFVPGTDLICTAELPGPAQSLIWRLVDMSQDAVFKQASKGGKR